MSSNKKYFEGEVKKAKVKLELQRRKELQIKEVEEQINLKKSEASKLRNKFEALQMECDKMDQQFRQEIKESKKFKKPMQLSGSSTSSIMEETKNLKSSRKLREPKIEPLDNVNISGFLSLLFFIGSNEYRFLYLFRSQKVLTKTQFIFSNV